MTPVPRTWSGAVFDKWVAWWYFNLPWEQCSYTVERQSIPLAHGIELAADLYRPVLRTNTKPAGTLLVRTPYGIGFPSSMSWGRVFAARGYQVLAVACRGTSGSGGKFYLFRDEVEDGAATVAWMKQQSWYTGSFATLGGSYLGYTQWALLAHPPADMKASVIESGPHDLGKLSWGTGALSPFVIAWSILMDHIYRGDPGPPRVLPTEEKVKPIVDVAPLLDSVDTFFKKEPPPWIHGILTKSDLTDTFWSSFRAGAALDRADIPILLFTGWYDIVREQVMEQYIKLSARGCTVAVTIGPWNHLEAQRLTKRESFDWLEEHFARRAPSPRPAPVRVFVTGSAQKWLALAAWPPPGEKIHDLYLGPNGTLSAEKPPADAQDSVFRFDPAEPTPSVGTSMFTSMDGGKDDDASLAARSDLLAFTMSTPLDRELEVLGRPIVELYHATSLPHADVLVRLSEVEAKGRSHNVAERYLRLSSTPQQPLQLELSDCAHRFRRGSKIRVTVAGGSHPQYVRNFGTGEPAATATSMKPVEHTIKHCVAAMSRVSLPINNSD